MKGRHNRAFNNYDAPQSTDAGTGTNPLQQEWQQGQRQQQLQQQAFSNRTQQLNGLIRNGAQMDTAAGGSQLIRQPSLNNSIMDIKYAPGAGDVSFRSFEYDKNTKQLSRMYSLSSDPKRGYQIWNSIGDGQMQLQGSNLIITNVKLDSKTGLFSYYSPQTQRFHTHNTHGERDKQTDLQKVQRGGELPQQANISPEQIRRQIAQSYGSREITNSDTSYRENLRVAAASGKPVVMTIGDSRDPRCKELIENINKAKQHPSGSKAHFIFVDLAKIPADKQGLGNYARENMLKFSGRPLTTVFNQTSSDGKTLTPNTPKHHQVGHEINTDALIAAINTANQPVIKEQTQKQALPKEQAQKQALPKEQAQKQALPKEQAQRQAPPTDRSKATQPKEVNKPAVIEKIGVVSAAFENEVRQVHARIPQHVRKQVEDAGYKIVMAPKYTDIEPTLVGVKPRGWPPGTSWDNAEGGHNGGSKTIGISERRLSDKNWINSDRVGGVLRHEYGHAVNLVWGKGGAGFSDTAEFAAAYERDKNNIAPLLKEKGSTNSADPLQRQKEVLAYFLQENGAGKDELFADAFAMLVGGASNTSDNALIAAAFPEVVKLIQKKLQKPLYVARN